MLRPEQVASVREALWLLLWLPWRIRALENLQNKTAVVSSEQIVHITPRADHVQIDDIDHSHLMI